LRDFRSRAIFEFFNTIGTKQTCRLPRRMPVVGGTADMFWKCRLFRFWHFSGLPTPLTNVGYQGKNGRAGSAPKWRAQAYIIGPAICPP
jgi:hypothetical protein